MLNIGSEYSVCEWAIFLQFIWNKRRLQFSSAWNSIATIALQLWIRGAESSKLLHIHAPGLGIFCTHPLNRKKLLICKYASAKQKSRGFTTIFSLNLSFSCLLWLWKNLFKSICAYFITWWLQNAVILTSDSVSEDIRVHWLLGIW